MTPVASTTRICGEGYTDATCYQRKCMVGWSRSDRQAYRAGWKTGLDFVKAKIARRDKEARIRKNEIRKRIEELARNLKGDN